MEKNIQFIYFLKTTKQNTLKLYRANLHYGSNKKKFKSTMLLGKNLGILEKNHHYGNNSNDDDI